MKKKYNMNLDMEKVEFLQSYLKKAGITWSAYINEFVNRSADGLAGIEIPVDLSSLTLGQAAGMFGKIAGMEFDIAKVKKRKNFVEKKVGKKLSK